MLFHIMRVCLSSLVDNLPCPFALLAAKHLDLLSKHRHFPPARTVCPSFLLRISYRDRLETGAHVWTCTGIQMSMHRMCRWMYAEVLLCFSLSVWMKSVFCVPRGSRNRRHKAPIDKKRTLKNSRKNCKSCEAFLVSRLSVKDFKLQHQSVLWHLISLSHAHTHFTFHYSVVIFLTYHPN